LDTVDPEYILHSEDVKARFEVAGQLRNAMSMVRLDQIVSMCQDDQQIGP